MISGRVNEQTSEQVACRQGKGEDRVTKETRQDKRENRVTKEQKANRSLQPLTALKQQEIIMTDSYLSNPKFIG